MGRAGEGRWFQCAPKAFYFSKNFVFSPKFRLAAATTATRAMPILSLQLYLYKPRLPNFEDKVRRGGITGGGCSFPLLYGRFLFFSSLFFSSLSLFGYKIARPIQDRDEISKVYFRMNDIETRESLVNVGGTKEEDKWIENSLLRCSFIYFFISFSKRNSIDRITIVTNKRFAKA